jgi:hypothetical protein
VGTDFNHDFGGGGTLLVGGGGQWAFTSHTKAGGPLPDGHKPSQYNLGFQVGIPGGWRCWRLLHVSYPNQGFFSLASTAAIRSIRARLAGHDVVSGISLNGTYALGPGISLEGQVAYTKYDPAVGTPSSTNPLSYDAVEIDTGIAVNF